MNEIGVTLGIPATIYVITWTWLGQKKVLATTNKREAELYFEQLQDSDQLRPEWHEYDLRKQGEPWIQTFGGIEVCETAYNHPDDPPGQHTNGPMAIWARVPGGEWVPTHSRKIHEVRFWCEGLGAGYIYQLLKIQREGDQ